MTEPSRSLPPHPSLEQQKKQAKELLKALRAGDANARERVRRHLPDKRRITLADAQFVLAREYGFESWVKLKAHIGRGAAAVELMLEAGARPGPNLHDAPPDVLAVLRAYGAGAG
ncbi:MAG TPA: hypothetical protein VF192_08200 [Longimicrobiales bacterium]